MHGIYIVAWEREEDFWQMRVSWGKSFMYGIYKYELIMNVHWFVWPSN